MKELCTTSYVTAVFLFKIRFKKRDTRRLGTFKKKGKNAEKVKQNALLKRPRIMAVEKREIKDVSGGTFSAGFIMCSNTSTKREKLKCWEI